MAQDTASMPEAAQFESQSEEDLGKLLDSAEVPAAKSAEPAVKVDGVKPPEGQTPPVVKPTVDPAKPPATGDAPAPVKEEVPAWAKDMQARYEQRLQKEFGQARSLQAKIDKLQKDLQDVRNPPVKLSQEEQEAQGALDAYIERRFGLKPGMVENVLPVIEEMNRQKQEAGYAKEMGSVAEEFGVDLKELDPIITKLITDKNTLAESGDEAAIAWREKILAPGGPAYLLAHAMREHSKELQAKGQEFGAAKLKTAEGAAQTLKLSGGAPVAAAGEPTQAEMNSMSEEQLNEWLQKNGGTGY